LNKQHNKGKWKNKGKGRLNWKEKKGLAALLNSKETHTLLLKPESIENNHSNKIK